MQPASFINIDCDLCISTYQALDFIFSNNLWQNGTIIRYNDWFSTYISGEEQAHNEIMSKYNIEAIEIVNIGDMRVFEIVSKQQTDNGGNLIQQEIDKIVWFQEIDFPDDLKIKDLHFCNNGPELEAGYRAGYKFIQDNLDLIDFTDKSVMDVGCADGKFSFYAENRGASYVFALDDLNITWMKGDGIHLAKKILKSNIEIDQHTNLYDIASLNRTFDIIMFFGVYYHLQACFYGLSQLRHCCHPDTTIIMSGVLNTTLPSNTANYIFNNAEESIFEVYTNVFSADVLRSFLEMAYFDVQKMEFMGPHSTVIVCKPFYGINKRHLYRPSFGLHNYDTRWPKNDRI
jgi:tRNA (mo5U34)-methyltransferase